MKSKKMMVYGLVLVLGIIMGILVVNLWQYMGGGNKEPLVNVMDADSTYYQVLERLFTGEKGNCEEIPSELSRYEEKTIVRTYYDVKEKQYHVTLDVYFPDAGQLREKRELFLNFDERLQWTTDQATAELWVFENDGYTHKDDLAFIRAGFCSAGIYIGDLKESDFPLHIQIKLVAPWAEEEVPEKISFEYGVW